MQNIFGVKKLIIKKLKLKKNLQKRKGKLWQERGGKAPPQRDSRLQEGAGVRGPGPCKPSPLAAAPSRRLRVRAGAVSANTLCGASPEKETFN